MALPAVSTLSAQPEDKAVELRKTLDRHGLDHDSLARRLREAMDLCLTTGRTAWKQNLTTKKMEQVVVPDLTAYGRLLELAGKWQGMEKPNGRAGGSGGALGNGNVTQVGIKFGIGLDKVERQRLKRALTTVEGELERRRLPDVLPGDSPPQDADPLS